MDIVLGAGIVGTSVALHLQARGRQVVLADRKGPASETSFGNAGLIEVSDLQPRSFPRRYSELFTHMLPADPRVSFDLGFLPFLLPWLMRYRHFSLPKSVRRIAREIEPLHLNALAEHRALLRAAGGLHLLRGNGWISLYHSGAIPEETRDGLLRGQDLGLHADILDADEIARRDPALRISVKAGIHWRDSASVSDPGEMVTLLAAHFERQGGTLVKADAATLEQQGKGWRITGPDGQIEAENVVVALGPWSGDLIGQFGYRYPLAVKRGYHMHYEIGEAERPRLPVIDIENGYAIAPMTRGMRLTTGIEFARRDAPPDPWQLKRCEPLARELYALGRRADKRPWLGARPCTADMKPVIGPAPRHKGMWFAFGHAHHGLTLGPVTGRIVAEMMTGEPQLLDAKPFLPSRFHLFVKS